MSFIPVSICIVSEEDAERFQNLGISPDKKSTLWINTNSICAFHGTDEGNTVVLLSNGMDVPIEMNVANFKDIIDKMDMIVEIARTGES